MNFKYKYFMIIVCSFIVMLFTWFAVIVAQHVKRALNQTQLAIIQCAISDYIIEGQVIPLPIFIAERYPKIGVITNVIVDRYNMPVQYNIRPKEDGVFISIYSSGEDKEWGTADDQRREGVLLDKF